ncbi:MAG: phosphate acyltransferase, partial [Acholeplasmatales bacterium]|nr:phosphate acyltransferase [Acholeplasmatales bacterium]
MVKIAVDGMGGDNAPKEICLGVMDSLKKNENIEILLFGDKEKMSPYLEEHKRLTIIDTKVYLEMGEKNPISAFKTKRDSSMFMAIDATNLDKADVVLTCGPTQAYIEIGR